MESVTNLCIPIIMHFDFLGFKRQPVPTIPIVSTYFESGWPLCLDFFHMRAGEPSSRKKISITKEICMRIDFPPEKIFWKKASC